MDVNLGGCHINETSALQQSMMLSYSLRQTKEYDLTSLAGHGELIGLQCL